MPLIQCGESAVMDTCAQVIWNVIEPFAAHFLKEKYSFRTYLGKLISRRLIMSTS